MKIKTHIENNSKQAGLHEYSNRQKAIHIISLLVFPSLFYYTLKLCQPVVSNNGVAWTMWFIVPSGMLFGDFLSGLVHWLCDTYGNENTPLVGQTIIKDFRLHHDYPRDITKHTFLSSNGNIALLGVVLQMPFFTIMIFSNNQYVALIVSFILLSFLFSAIANEIHKMAHQFPEDNPKIVRILQKYHILLNPEHHSKHHAAPYDRNYCITFGWMNHLLDKINFWRSVEWLILKLFKTKPVVE